MSSSSSSEAKWPYDIFLKLQRRGDCHGFLASLHRAMLHGGINAYIDSEDLRPGNDISLVLTKAIMEGQITVLIFSKNYTSSWWCMDADEGNVV